MAHSHSMGLGTGMGPEPEKISLYIVPLTVLTVHTTQRQGQGTEPGTNGGWGVHTHFPLPSHVPGPVQCV